MIKKTYTFKANIGDVWDALTDPFMILAWSKYPATMSEQPGAEFSLWEGDVHGTNIEVIPRQKLVQNWFGGDWDAPSIVTFTLRKGDDGYGTILDLEHTGVPSDERANFERGWDEYYIGPIMELLQPLDFPPEQRIVNDIPISEIFHENILWDVYPDDPMPVNRNPFAPVEPPTEASGVAELQSSSNQPPPSTPAPEPPTTSGTPPSPPAHPL